MKNLKTPFIAALVIISTIAFGQPVPKKNQLSILFGLNQPLLLKGFNMEVNYWSKKFVIDYSHGVGLHLDGEFVGGKIEDQRLDLKVPQSLGLGFGYRITKNLNLRVEPKLHLFEVYYQGEPQTKANRINNYSTFTLGAGVYYRWMPFENKDTGWKGLTMTPSIRYWPNASSSLSGNKFTYNNKLTGKSEIHEAANIGAGNTPWIINISVGYTF